MPARTKYDAVAITLHWVIALGILVQLAMGLSMAHLALPIALKFRLYQLHKSIGLTVLAAVLLRLVWRVTHRPPALPPMPALEAKAATGTHHLLYALMLFIPLTGWLVTSVSPLHIPTAFWGVLPVPFLPVPAGWVTDAGTHRVESLHAWAAYIILATVVIHAGAALRHHFLLRDNVLRRMLPFTKG